MFASLLKGLQGEIKHLYRSFAFLSSKMVIENGGILVCKTKHLVLAGGGKVRDSGVKKIAMRTDNRRERGKNDKRLERESASPQSLLFFLHF